MSKKLFISADHGMAIAGLKPHAWHMKALRAGLAISADESA
jgi:hypothetical protein